MRLRQEDKQERRWSIPVDQRTGTAQAITRATVGIASTGGLGLHIRWDALDRDEQHELVALTTRALGEERAGISLDRLDRKQAKRWESLVERAAGATGVFAQARELAEVERLGARALAEARKPKPRPKWEEAGAVVLPRYAVFDWLNRPDPILELEHLGLLVYVLAQLENNTALCPHGRVEGSGDTAVLVIDGSYGIGAKYDPESRFANWRDTLQHLVLNHWLTVDRRGQEFRVARGPRALKVAKGRRES